MNVKYIGLTLFGLTLALLSMSTDQARGQVASSEPILVTLSSLPPGNVFENFYPNEFDLARQKRFTFTGSFTNADLQQPAFVDLWFDWTDPRDPAGTPPRTTGIFPIDLAPGQVKTYGLGALPAITTTIPICPPQVSIHIQNNGPGQPVVVDGTFTHECLVPEPCAAILAALGTIGLLAVRRRRAT